MGLVQIQRHRGRIEQVPRGETPIIELDLEPDREIISVDLSSHEYGSRRIEERKTVDWAFTVYTAWRA